MITEIDNAAQIIGQHEAIALQFSGGKDSLACLYLLRPYWDKLTVTWVNTGAAFPETIEQMRRVAAMVPHFFEIKTNQPAQNAKFGLPVDLLPLRLTCAGKSLQPNDGTKMQGYLDCCWANFWMPMQQAMTNLGITLIIRGQRSAEAKKAPIKSGHQQDGTTIWFPLEHWSDQQVFDYLAAEGVEVPEYYKYTGKSLDCWSCTAYLDESIGKMRYTREKHPGLWKVQQQRLMAARQAIRDELARQEYTEASRLIDTVES